MLPKKSVEIFVFNIFNHLFLSIF